MMKAKASRQNPIRVTVPFENAVSRALQAPSISDADLEGGSSAGARSGSRASGSGHTSKRPACHARTHGGGAWAHTSCQSLAERGNGGAVGSGDVSGDGEAPSTARCRGRSFLGWLGVEIRLKMTL